MIFEIKHRFSGSVLFKFETANLKLCVEAAVKSGAYLRGAYLRGAKIQDGIVITKEPIQITGLYWLVTIWDEHMQIGCEFHSHEEWRGFSKAESNKEDCMNYELKRGQALVIIGPKACGKTTLARKIAAAHGSYEELDAHELESPFGFSVLLQRNSKTLIVDGLPVNSMPIKKMIVSRQVIINVQYKASELIDSPNFIFCTEQRHWIEPADRQFFIIDLEKPS